MSEKNTLKDHFKEGLIVRYDITPEAAVAKMGYLLGKGHSMKKIRTLF
jgi:L-asparaginase/Glu-tRNA(Gln) amidotransferase subunit D